MQANAMPHRCPPHEGVAGKPDLFRQFLDIAAGQFRSDARLAGVLKLDLNGVEVDHFVPLCFGPEAPELKTG
jgi:hypothetical protein